MAQRLVKQKAQFTCVVALYNEPVQRSPGNCMLLIQNRIISGTVLSSVMTQEMWLGPETHTVNIEVLVE